MRHLLVLISLIAIACSGPADKQVKTLDSFLRAQQQFYDFNGNVLVAERGVVVYKKSFGVADFTSGRELNDSSVFELASVSKQFTASGVLLLVQEGKLSLRDTLRKFFPQLPYSGVTLRHMLTHTSGLPDYESLMHEKWNRAKIAHNTDMITFLADEKAPMHFAPGTQWEYSNTAFALLASIIEEVSRQSFAEFMQQRIFIPLNMRHTRVYNTRRSGEVVQNYAYGYVWSDSLERYVLPDSVPELSMVYWLDGIVGDGIINSTTSDLLSWDRAMVSHTLLPEDVLNQMTGRQAVVDSATQEYYGYGVFAGRNPLGSYVTHSGGWPGYSTNLLRYSERDVTIIVLSNNQSAARAISNSLAHIMHNKPVAIANAHTAVALSRDEMTRFTGKYSIRGTEFEIRLSNDSLWQVFPSDDMNYLQAETTTTLFYPGRNDVQVVIEKDAQGHDRYYRIVYGVKEEMDRLQ
jgi:CubicO group peptidase (beta-lactamase class C family)